MECLTLRASLQYNVMCVCVGGGVKLTSVLASAMLRVVLYCELAYTPNIDYSEYKDTTLLKKLSY